MIDGLKTYPKMKDSGVPWLGEVPEHWEVGTLRRKLRAYDGIKIGPFGSQLKLEQMVESGFKVYGQANVIARDFARGRKFISQGKFDELSACEVRRGDLVITMMGTSGRCAKVPDDAAPGIMDSHLVRLRTTPDVNSTFAARLIDEAPYIKEQIEVVGKGSIMHGLNSSMIKDLLLALPPLPEQSAIVRFLDHADRRIRRYIRAKQKLIKLLEERVAARTSEVMRHPGCTMQRLGRVVTEDVRSIVREDAETYVALGLYNRGRGIFHKRPTLGAELGDSTFSWVEPGDLVISGQFAWEGAVALASSTEKRAIVSHRYYVLRGVTDRANTPYLWALLRSDFGAMLLDQHSRGAAGRNRPLNLRTLLKEPVPVPPLEAQLSVNELLAENGPLHAQATRQIALLREYRTRLIADVVTGKLDVREAAKQLPDEVREPEPLDEIEAEADADEADAGDTDTEPEEAEA